jgi:hypothetical protein
MSWNKRNNFHFIVLMSYYNNTKFNECKTKQNTFSVPIHISFYVLTIILNYRLLKLINLAKGARTKSEQKTNLVN